MIAVLVSAMIALVVSLVGTPFAIRLFRAQGYGQLIRDDGPEAHHTKRGTPTMGGAVIIVAAILGYLVAHVTGQDFTASGLLALFVMAGLGVVGFLDDFIKIRKQRSLGLTARTKFVGQLVISVAFALLALHYVGESISKVSFVRDTAINLGAAGFIFWVYVMLSATSNGVNLTDGLDGLASGSSAMVFAAYVVITFWQFGNRCPGTKACYLVRDPLDLAIVAAAMMGACFGFLWWNAAPAKIFMGDTGSLSLGGTLAALAILSRTELLLVILGGLFVVETLSVILQVAFFKLFRRRIFNMAPVHHHFELAGWPEFTVIVRFWIVAGLAVAFGLGLFYAEYLSHRPLG